MAGAASGLAIAGGAIQAKAALDEGQAQAAAAQYNYQEALNNAAESRAQSVEEARRLRVIGRKQLGSIRAAAGGSGVALEGSAMDVLEESAANAELDALTIRHAGEVKAVGYENAARLEKYRGRAALEQAQLRSAAAILGAGGQAASYQYGGSRGYSGKRV